MPPKLRLRACAVALFTAAFAMPASAQAVVPGGGAAYPGSPTVESARCATGERWSCAAGETLTVRGDDLQEVRSVAFTGRRGGKDDKIAKPRRVAESSFVVVVPEDARSGRLRVRSSVAVSRSPRAVRVTQRRLAVADAEMPSEGVEQASDGMVFPIQGRHDMGQTQTNGFGGGRGHQGHDLFAACGTPLVAVVSGTVQQKAYHSAAGNYVVLKAAGGESYAYMHLRSASPLKTGERVSVGNRVGDVGDSGRATGCHLHFEEWTAPGWYTGGKAVDPLLLLERLEAAPHEHS